MQLFITSDKNNDNMKYLNRWLMYVNVTRLSDILEDDVVTVNKMHYKEYFGII